MGPYYVTALVHLLGPVQSVAAMTRISFAERIASSEGRRGERLPVNVPTHVAGTLAMASGPLATMIMSFDVWGHTMPRIEIYGSEGTLSVPDPNTFEGPVRLLRAGSQAWEDVPLTHSDTVLRGVGVADMAQAIAADTPHRASGELAYHVLDVMHSFYDSSDEGHHIQLLSTCVQPAPLPIM